MPIPQFQYGKNGQYKRQCGLKTGFKNLKLLVLRITNGQEQMVCIQMCATTYYTLQQERIGEIFWQGS